MLMGSWIGVLVGNLGQNVSHLKNKEVGKGITNCEFFSDVHVVILTVGP